MATWDLFQRMLQTPAKDLHKIEKAIVSRYRTNHEASELYSVISDWEEGRREWLDERDQVSDDDAKQALIDEGLL